MNKKSFFLGVLVGISVTWALSFYLYYVLNSNQNTITTAKFQKNIFNSAADDYSSSEEAEDNQIVIDKIEQIGGKSAYVKEKYNKYEKDQKKRKISQKLLEELQPVTQKQDPEFGIIRDLNDQFIRDSGYKTHAFNVLISNQIGLIRDIPDTRHKV